MMINKLNKKAKMKKILLFLFCFSAHTNLYVLFPFTAGDDIVNIPKNIAITPPITN